MSVVQTLIGNVKGPQGDTGATGETGATGSAATVTVGSTSTTAYGNAASVTNSGTSSAAVLDFVIPQGAPGATVTELDNLALDTITTSTASFPVPAIYDTGKVIFGKIIKWFTDALSRINKNTSNLATIEDSTTASQAYAVGDYLTYNGSLYKVTAAIASGGTISPGSNCTQTNVGTQLDSLNDALTNKADAVVSTSWSATINSSGSFYFPSTLTPSTCAPIILYEGTKGYTYTIRRCVDSSGAYWVALVRDALNTSVVTSETITVYLKYIPLS